MQIQTFKKASVLLSTCFPDRKFEPEVYFELLKDLPDESFLKAVISVAKETRDIFPGTNLIAVLRDKTFEFERKKRESESHEHLKIAVDRPKVEPGSLMAMYEQKLKETAEALDAKK